MKLHQRSALVAGLVASAFGFAAAAAVAHPSIDVVAANWKFTPNTITVPLGEPTTLRLTSSEGVHGLASKRLNIPMTTIMPHRFVTATFTPSKVGTYVVHCAIICGAGHPDMALTIKVVK